MLFLHHFFFYAGDKPSDSGMPGKRYDQATSQPQSCCDENTVPRVGEGCLHQHWRPTCLYLPSAERLKVCTTFTAEDLVLKKKKKKKKNLGWSDNWITQL
ncbi:hypothetical protein LEMLEM_LOCUS13670 [Lemmus lemmus]